MKCPYCVSDINSKALVCKSCNRDIFLPKQLLLRISYLEKQLQTSQTRKTEESDFNSLAASSQPPQVPLTTVAKFQVAALDFLKFFCWPTIFITTCTSMYHDRLRYENFVLALNYTDLANVLWFFVMQKSVAQ